MGLHVDTDELYMAAWDHRLEFPFTANGHVGKYRG